DRWMVARHLAGRVAAGTRARRRAAAAGRAPHRSGLQDVDPHEETRDEEERQHDETGQLVAEAPRGRGCGADGGPAAGAEARVRSQAFAAGGAETCAAVL